MRRLVMPSIALLSACALLALLAFGVANQGENTSIDAAVAHGQRPLAPAAQLALPGLGATATRTLASLRGEVVLVNIFASWCDPCQAEAPLLEHEQQLLARQHATVLGVTYEDTTTDSQQFAHRWHLTYPIVRDVNGALVRAYGTNAVPETFVIDRQGRIAAVRRFQLDGAWLAQTLPPILGQRS